MALRKHIQMRKNKLSLSVFQAEEDGKVLLSIDKDFASRRIKGPLFTEQELGDILWLIEDYNEWESKGIHRIPADEQSKGNLPGYNMELAQAEIRSAIAAVQQTEAAGNHEARDNGQNAPRITILPTMPEFTYIYTCRRCGCHIASQLLVPGGSRL